MRAGTTWRVALCAALLWASCGPPGSVHPLSDPASARPDDRLIGVWDLVEPREADDEEEEASLRFTALQDGMTEIRDSDEELRLRMFPTELHGRSYMNLQDVREPGPWLIARYELGEDGALAIWLMNDEAVRGAIERGELKGEIPERSSQSALITAEPDELAEFLRAADPGTLYPEPMRLRKRAAAEGGS
jgi:hypothetical protein